MGWSQKKQPGHYGGRPWRRLRDAVLRRDNGLCQPCYRATPQRLTLAREVHHVVAKANGGADTLENLVAICAPCHAAATLAQLGRTQRPRYDRNGRRIVDDRGVVWKK